MNRDRTGSRLATPTFRIAIGALVLLGISLLALVDLATAQDVSSRGGMKGTQPLQSQVTVVPGEEYAAGWLKRVVLGDDHRDLWTTPVRVPVLDLASFAGGLTPLRRGGGMQTRSLRFLGGDGKEYTFRSVNKDPSAVLDSILRGTVVDALVQDGISAAHPVGALAAAPLLEAAGVLHVTPRLTVLPDHPALGEYREDFAGVLGLIEEHPDENDKETPSFAGAHRVAGSEALLERIQEGPDDLVDQPAYLRARLMDVFLGDWDRHRDQWRWATVDDEAPRRWLPIPRDRDQAFSDFDGLAMSVVRRFVPQFVTFGARYPDPARLHWSARQLDRRFLQGLEWDAWSRVAADLQARLTDQVLAEAIAHLPAEQRAGSDEELLRALMQRRDDLESVARDFYLLLARDVDIRVTDASEHISIDRSAPDTVVVEVAREEGGAPLFRRRFLASETREIRVYMGRGQDRVHVWGGHDSIRLRLVAGRGRDTLAVDDAGTGVRVYDERERVTVVGTGKPHVDTRPFDEWEWSEDDRDQPRDWGSAWFPIAWSSYSTDTGVLLGGGFRRHRYGFRQTPYASMISVKGGWAPAVGRGAAEISLRKHRSNSSVYVEGSARATGLEVLHYFGTGNDSPGGDRETHRVDLGLWEGALRVGGSPVRGLDVAVGLRFRRAEAGANTGRYFATVREDLPGGTGAFDDVSVFSEVNWPFGTLGGDSRVAGKVVLQGSVSPALLDAHEAFGLTSSMATVAFVPVAEGPLTLLARGGASAAWGAAPWNYRPFLGGPETLRGFEEDRFTGDRAVFASLETWLRMGYVTVLVPVESGVFGFIDSGRVADGGASPGGLHTSVGGGVWMRPFGQENTLRVGVGRSDEGVRLYAGLGVPWR